MLTFVDVCTNNITRYLKTKLRKKSDIFCILLAIFDNTIGKLFNIRYLFIFKIFLLLFFSREILIEMLLLVKTRNGSCNVVKHSDPHPLKIFLKALN